MCCVLIVKITAEKWKRLKKTIEFRCFCLNKKNQFSKINAKAKNIDLFSNFFVKIMLMSCFRESQYFHNVSVLVRLRKDLMSFFELNIFNNVVSLKAETWNLIRNVTNMFLTWQSFVQWTQEFYKKQFTYINFKLLI